MEWHFKPTDRLDAGLRDDPGLTIASRLPRLVQSIRELARPGEFHVGHRHVGPWARLLRGGCRLHLCLRATLDFLRVFLERAVIGFARKRIGGDSHDLRLFTCRPRLRGPAVLPDLRAVAAGAVLNAARGPRP